MYKHLLWICPLFFCVFVGLTHNRRFERKLANFYSEYFINQDSRLYKDSVANLNQIILEQASYGQSEYLYHPRFDVIQKPYSGRYINVSLNNGFSERKTHATQDIGANAKFSIICIGGSTTFGFFIHDDQTYPSHLSRILEEQGFSDFAVRNLGVTGYNPFQETALFEELLYVGQRPTLVVFLDGYNLGEQHSGGSFSNDFNTLFRNKTRLTETLTNQIRTRLYVLFSSMTPESMFGGNDMLELEQQMEQYPDLYVNRYLYHFERRKELGLQYGVQVLNILQPISFVKNPFPPASKLYDYVIQQNMQKPYLYLYEELSKRPDNFIDFTDLLVKYNAPAMIDLVHYTGDFNRFLANELATIIQGLDLKKVDKKQKEAISLPFYLN